MFISPKFNALFIHCPKTAGSAIRQLFTELDPSLIRLIDHMKASRGRGAIHGDSWDRLFKFSVCRHPCEQLVSHYAYVLAHPEHGYYQRAVEGGFSAWLRWKEDTEDHSGICARFMDLPLDFVMRFEHLEQDFETLKERLGIDPAITLPVVNVGENKPERWQDWIKGDDLEYVKERFSADFTRFGYELPESVNVSTV